MAEPVDYFMQGVGLGQRSRSIRNQEDQFRTNLAERARQANQMFDLRQKETESQISRNNLYVKKLDYDMSQQKKQNDEETVQLDSLKKYKDSLSETANDQSFPSLPLPPSDLTGAFASEAMQAHNAYIASRKENKQYQYFVKQQEDEMELYDYGLPVDWQSRPDGDFRFTAAQDNRANAKAREIEARFRVNQLEANAKGITASNFIGMDGKLNEAAYENAISNLSPLVETQRQMFPSGGETRIFTPKEVIKQRRRESSIKTILEDRSRLESSVSKRRQALSGEGFTPEEIADKIDSEFPADWSDGSQELRKGDEVTSADGKAYIYAGGNPKLESSWLLYR